MAITYLPEYPAPPGNKMEAIVTINGVSTYGALTTATPPTGGQDVLAKDLGFVQVEFVSGSCSDNGQYAVRVCYPSNPAQGVTTFKLQWITAATGADAGTVDLSARTVRLLVRGRI